MAKGYSFKNVKIKPENQVTAEGFIESFDLAGSSTTSIMFMRKITLTYKVLVRVEGVENPLVLKLKNNFGWGFGIAKELEVNENKFIGFPFEIGDKITVAYDRTKPKKCNKID